MKWRDRTWFRFTAVWSVHSVVNFAHLPLKAILRLSHSSISDLQAFVFLCELDYLVCRRR